MNNTYNSQFPPKDTAKVNGKNFEINEEDGLDPNTALAIEYLIIKLAKPYMGVARCLGYERGDLVQEGFIGALEAAKTFRPDGGASYPTWAAYKILEKIRHLCRHPFTESLDEIGPEAEPADPADYGHDAELTIETKQILSNLTKEEQELLEKSFGLGENKELSLQEIASERACSVSTVNAKINKTLNQIRRSYGHK
jgi:RNA polymerase sigma factor (sigma-70 family)